MIGVDWSRLETVCLAWFGKRGVCGVRSMHSMFNVCGLCGVHSGLRRVRSVCRVHCVRGIEKR